MACASSSDEIHSKATRVTVIIPCCNEEAALPELKEVLQKTSDQLGKCWQLHFLFVDDGSTDDTWPVLQKLFAEWPVARLIQHPENRGISAAIMTGIEAADSEIVCTIDSDGTYDPRQLESLLPLLTPDVSVVTASPYHPQGAVYQVPGWRLFLSQGVSFLYRRVMRQKMYTYTSCFRVYRRSDVLELDLRERGFIGIVEVLWKFQQQGSRIVEAPASLTVRHQGQSKMKILRVAVGHLGMLGRALVERVLK